MLSVTPLSIKPFVLCVILGVIMGYVHGASMHVYAAIQIVSQFSNKSVSA